MRRDGRGRVRERPRPPGRPAEAAPSAGPALLLLLPGVWCRLNRFGIREKVLVTQAEVRCIDTAGAGGQPTGPRLRYFWPYFVFETVPASTARRRSGTCSRT